MSIKRPGAKLLRKRCYTKLMLSSAVLQWVAAIAMLLDHAGLFLFGGYWPLRLIGRIALPIYMFMLVEGFTHTHSRPKYLMRISIFALISELPWFIMTSIARADYVHNAMFTIMLSFLALLAAERGKAWWLLVPIIAVLASLLKVDYGGFAVILAVMFFLIKKYLQKAPFLRAFYLLAAILLCMGGVAVVNVWSLEWWAALGALPLLLYNGKRGRRMPRYFFYAYYPAHLLVLMVIRLVTF